MSYAAKHAAAYRMVKNAGLVVAFTRSTPTYDPATDSMAATSSTVVGAAVQTKGDPIRYQALGLIEAEAPTLLFAAQTYGEKPLPGDTVVWGGVQHTARAVYVLGPDAVPIKVNVIVAR